MFQKNDPQQNKQKVEERCVLCVFWIAIDLFHKAYTNTQTKCLKRIFTTKTLFFFFWIIKIKEMILNIIHSEPKNFLLDLSVKAINCALLYTVCIRWNTLWITSEDEILEQFNWSGWLFNFKSIMGIDSEPHWISTVLPPRCLSLTHRRDVAKIGTKTY